MGISPQPRDPASRLARIERSLATLTSRVPSPPHLAVPLYQLWQPAAAGYSTIPASSAVNALLWEGRVELGSHPCLSVDGVWGDLDSATVTVTYQLKVGTVTATWQATGQQTVKHLVDIRPLIGESNLQVTLTVADIGTAAGTHRILVQPLGVYLRQMPDDGVFG